MHDDYMTPKSAWESIAQFIPKDKVIWEAFYGDGESGNYLRELGFDTIHEPVDFFENDLGDVVVSNPPFSAAKRILIRMKALRKPFILILPASKMCTRYFRDNFKDEDSRIQIIVPSKRIQFLKRVDGVIQNKDGKGSCNFDCFYYCWRMDLDRDLTWATD